ncbi:FecCD family ABC transporter permease [Orenia marismortui]|uniref:FecCD family ABC transporter permease n=1 Tax=Orenia marismortui TaxID=46469 RepID=UPI0003602E55
MMSTNKREKFILTGIILITLIILTFIISLNLGSFSIDTWDIIKTLLGQGTNKQEIVIFSIRLPRIILAILVATGLAISGTVLQAITKNDLADPGILGINSGAALAVVIYIYYMNGNVYAGISNTTIFTMPLIALLGAVLGSFLIYTFAWKKGINATRLILIGIGINAAFQALLIVFQLKFTTQEFNRVMVWTSGSIWGSNWKYVFTILPWLLFFIVLTFYKSRYLDVLNLGDELSIGLGVEVEKERRVLLLASVALAGVATAVAGSISFLGLISPHISRRLVGAKHKMLIPTASLVGTLLLLAADTIARNLLAPIELPVGIVMSIIGVPYFIYLMIKE